MLLHRCACGHDADLHLAHVVHGEILRGKCLTTCGCQQHRAPRLLDAFCCAGGAAEGYARSGFEVVGIDKNPQPNYPFEFIQGDALEHLRNHDFTDTFDAIHASPPCQTFCAYRRKGHGVGGGYEDLIEWTRRALIATGRPWIMENVPGAPLESPVRLCGSSFGLDVRRHRLFETNWPLMVPPCDHSWQTPRFKPATNRTNLRSTVEVGVWRIPLDVQKAAMGIDREITLRELSEALPPAYTEHIGRELHAYLYAQEASHVAA
jgi:DNA (cytosine-5)-methyltransferase 1